MRDGEVYRTLGKHRGLTTQLLQNLISKNENQIIKCLYIYTHTLHTQRSTNRIDTEKSKKRINLSSASKTITAFTDGDVENKFLNLNLPHWVRLLPL